ncbi:putative keratin-associated protein 4-16 [Mya arenaria]|uniref:putative keratin-associated protein 4-16 n=1 Tax=Mya arenaria TaxID=6604 RepID=UPI0022DF5C3A|nr:putative keratin-associated protein 4-16 [Mya arenaria]
MDKVQLAGLIVVACFTFGSFAQRNIFQTSCPMGCLSSTCYISTGCTGSCMAGWCKFYGGRNVGMVCTPRCSRGQICQNGFCTRDRTSTCTPRCRIGQVCKNGICTRDKTSTCIPRCRIGQVCKHGICTRDRTTCFPRCRSWQVCQRGFCRSATRTRS